MDLAMYRGSCRTLTEEHCTDPAKTTRDWAALWRSIFDLSLRGGGGSAQAIFEPCSLIIARWEFLGSLVTGHDKVRSDRSQAGAFVNAYLKLVNPQYMATHPTIRTTMHVWEILFQMVRNGSLHGFTPAAIYDPSTDKCITWSMGPGDLDPARYPNWRHLNFEDDALCINGSRLTSEIHDAMLLFADDLEKNINGRDGRKPTDKFREGFRWRLAPSLPANHYPLSWSF